MTVPNSSPHDPLRRRQDNLTSWPVPDGRRVGAYLADDGNWEVLHVGFRHFEDSHNGSVHVHRADAEVVAAALAVVLTAQVTA